jgi:hypothetical protein
MSAAADKADGGPGGRRGAQQRESLRQRYAADALRARLSAAIRTCGGSSRPRSSATIASCCSTTSAPASPTLRITIARATRRSSGYAQDVLDVCRRARPARRDLRRPLGEQHDRRARGERAPQRFSRMIMVGRRRATSTTRDYVGGFERADIEGLLDLMDKNFIGWANFLAPVIMKNPDRPELGRSSRKLLLHRSEDRAPLRRDDVLRRQPRICRTCRCRR